MSFSNYRKLKKITSAVVKRHVVEDTPDQNEESKQTTSTKRVSFADDNESAVLNKQKKVNTNPNQRHEKIKRVNQEYEEEEDKFEDADHFIDEVEEDDIKNAEALDPNYDSDEWLEDDDTVNGLIDRFGDMQVSEHPVVTDDTELKKKNRETQNELKPFLGTDKDLEKGEVLEYDNEAYDLFHRATTEWPCLSFDVLLPENNLLEVFNPQKAKEIDYPLCVYTVAGTQAEKNPQNGIYFMKWYKLHKTRFDDDSDVYDEEDLDNDDESALKLLSIKHPSGVNRIRSMNGTGVVALWDERGRVSVYNGIEHLKALYEFEEKEEEQEDDEELEQIKKNKKNQKKTEIVEPKDPNKKGFLVSEFKHQSEGFALQWNPQEPGQLVSGSGDGSIYFYRPADETGSKFVIDQEPFCVTDGSIEDIQFCPKDKNIIAACSTDGRVYFIDTRTKDRSCAEGFIQASKTDVNVISWNSSYEKLLATGADDGAIQVWDVRYVNKKNRSLQNIRWHKEPITSIEFQPFEESVITAACADNRISVWDFSVEADKKSKQHGIPDQLMFVHQGFQDAKEIKHHPIQSDFVMATALSGFHIFKPNYDEEEELKEY